MNRRGFVGSLAALVGIGAQAQAEPAQYQRLEVTAGDDQTRIVRLTTKDLAKYQELLQKAMVSGNFTMISSQPSKPPEQLCIDAKNPPIVLDVAGVETFLNECGESATDFEEEYGDY